MEIITASSVSEALGTALHQLETKGIPQSSRNGSVLVMPTPVVTVYTNPLRRVLFSPLRDANPFFHLMEALWMLAGKNDLLFPMQFNQRFREYSDDGSTIWGAYGWRWREFFGYDQLEFIARDLRANPYSRRAVLAMWNAAPELAGVESHGGNTADLFVAADGGKDVPCNTHVYFDCRDGKLNMTVCNRSNDAWWGAYGANAVHFSVLQEYMAAKVGVSVGVYRQFSNNLHLYTDIVQADRISMYANDARGSDRYTTTHANAALRPMVDCNIHDWERDLHRLVARDGIPNEHGWHSTFFRDVARPMYMAHDAWRHKQYDEAEEIVIQVTAWDWRIAAWDWLERRRKNREAKEVNTRG